MRFGVPIYTTEMILSEAGIVANDSNKDEEEISIGDQEIASSNKPFGERLKDMSSDELTKSLEDALAREDYEIAAKIRDEISRRNWLSVSQ